MKKFSLIFMLCWCSFSFAQIDTLTDKRLIQHGLYVEFLGSSANLYNIGYDCTFAFSKKHKIALASGIGYIPFKDPFVGVSFQASYLYGFKHHLELGVGVALPDLYSPYSVKCTYDNGRENCTYRDWKFYIRDVVIPVRVGYRYQRSDGGFFGRIAFVPAFSKAICNTLNMPFLPSPGLSVGYIF